MKLLFDENLSPKLVRLSADVFPNSAHVRDVGLASASDEDVWQYARRGDYVIATRDSDFHQRSLFFGFPPKVVWFRRGNCSTAAIVEMLVNSHEAITRFISNAESAFLVVE